MIKNVYPRRRVGNTSGNVMFFNSIHSRSGRGKPTGLKLLNFTWERKTSHAANFSARRVFLLHCPVSYHEVTMAASIVITRVLMLFFVICFSCLISYLTIYCSGQATTSCKNVKKLQAKAGFFTEHRRLSRICL